MELSPEDRSYVTEKTARSDRVGRWMLATVALLTLVFCGFVVSAFVKSGFDRSLLPLGAIGLLPPVLLLRFLRRYINGKEFLETHDVKERISGRLRSREGWLQGTPYMVFFIDDHRVAVFPDLEQRLRGLQEGQWIEAWAMPVKHRHPDNLYLRAEPGYLLLSIIDNR